MLAQHKTKCAVCGDWIEVGDDIVYSPYADDYIHEECNED